MFSKTFNEKKFIALNVNFSAMGLQVNKTIHARISITGNLQNITIEKYVHNPLAWEATINEFMTYCGEIESGSTLSIVAYGMDTTENVNVEAHLYCNFGN